MKKKEQETKQKRKAWMDRFTAFRKARKGKSGVDYSKVSFISENEIL